MTTFIWQSQDGNWNNTQSWDRGATPAAGNDIIFPNNNRQSVTAGLDQSATGKFGSIVIHRGFGGSLGTAVNPLIASAASVLHRGSGTLHYKDGGNVTDLLTINTDNRLESTLSGFKGSSKVSGLSAATTAGNATVDLSADAPDLSSVAVDDWLWLQARTDGQCGGEYFRITAKDDVLDTVTVSPAPSTTTTLVDWVIYADTGITEVRVAGGKVHLQALTMQTLAVAEASTRVGRARSEIQIDASCSNYAYHYQNAGRVNSDVSVSLAYLSGGAFIASTANRAAFGGITLMGGNMIINSTGVVGSATVMGGTLDYSQDAREKTLYSLFAWPGARVIIPDWVTVVSGGLIVTPPTTGG
jgi:hypothetical protein